MGVDAGRGNGEPAARCRGWGCRQGRGAAGPLRLRPAGGPRGLPLVGPAEGASKERGPVRPASASRPRPSTTRSAWRGGFKPDLMQLPAVACRPAPDPGRGPERDRGPRHRSAPAPDLPPGPAVPAARRPAGPSLAEAGLAFGRASAAPSPRPAPTCRPRSPSPWPARKPPRWWWGSPPPPSCALSWPPGPPRRRQLDWGALALDNALALDPVSLGRGSGGDRESPYDPGYLAGAYVFFSRDARRP